MIGVLKRKDERRRTKLYKYYTAIVPYESGITTDVVLGGLTVPFNSHQSTFFSGVTRVGGDAFGDVALRISTLPSA
jgi:hypothetical protein